MMGWHLCGLREVWLLRNILYMLFLKYDINNSLPKDYHIFIVNKKLKKKSPVSVGYTQSSHKYCPPVKWDYLENEKNYKVGVEKVEISEPRPF